MRQWLIVVYEVTADDKRVQLSASHASNQSVLCMSVAAADSTTYSAAGLIKPSPYWGHILRTIYGMDTPPITLLGAQLSPDYEMDTPPISLLGHIL